MQNMWPLYGTIFAKDRLTLCTSYSSAVGKSRCENVTVDNAARESHLSDFSQVGTLCRLNDGAEGIEDLECVTRSSIRDHFGLIGEYWPMA